MADEAGKTPETAAPSVTVSSGFTGQMILWCCILAFAVGAIISGFVVHKWDTVWAAEIQAKLSEAREKIAGLTAKKDALELELIRERANIKKTTSIEYVPKEVVVYIDPRTGREVTSTELESINLTQRPDKFYFSVTGPSGKSYPGKFTKTDKERWVFDQNKGQFTTESEIKLTVELPKQQPRLRLGVYGGGAFGKDDSEAAGGLRLSRQAKNFDADLRINAVKKRAEAELTFWLW